MLSFIAANLNEKSPTHPHPVASTPQHNGDMYIQFCRVPGWELLAPLQREEYSAIDPRRAPEGHPLFTR